MPTPPERWPCAPICAQEPTVAQVSTMVPRPTWAPALTKQPGFATPARAVEHQYTAMVAFRGQQMLERLKLGRAVCKYGCKLSIRRSPGIIHNRCGRLAPALKDHPLLG
jgi:hypothetical protein